MNNFKDKARILYISSVDISIGNGPGVNEREFTQGLYKAIKDRAHFLIPKPSTEITELPASVCTYTIPHRVHNPLLYPLHILSEIYQAHRLLSRRNFDLIVFRLDILPIAPYVITRWHKTPYALKTLGQGMINVLGEKLGLVGKVLGNFNLSMVKKIFKGAILADSVSVAQVELLKEILKEESEKIIWIDNTVNTSRFYPMPATKVRRELGLSAFDPIIGYVGTRPWERGGMQLIEVTPELIKKYPDLGVVILGDGSGLDDMKEKAKELGVADHCIFTGYVPFDTVPGYINSLDVGVSISLRPDRFAASELKVRQYLACGKPVILSPGSNDFVLKENLGSEVQPRDLEAIRIVLDHWLSLSPTEREEFCNRTAGYIQDNLSIDAAILRRFELWSRQLQAS